ncbi:hypothetical protein [Streptomyces sp. CL12]|uniref:hypothetical protein n=1 Tax=Streptomyces sp. CL12 TaxID=3391744 RepID=UPI003A813B6E
MIKTEDLTHETVRDFVQAFNDQDMNRLYEIAPCFTSNAGDLKGLRSQCTGFVAVEEADGGLTLDGFTAQRRHPVPMRWEFTVDHYSVEQLRITTDVPVSSDTLHKVLTELEEDIPARAAAVRFAQARDSDGRTHPKGTARRMRLGDHFFVHEWDKGGLGEIDWIVTSEKADDDVFRSVRSPSSGDHDDRGGGARKVSSVSSHLELELGWDGDGFQKATASYWAKPFYWDAVKWYGEDRTLTEAYIPQITGTLTLTGPDGAAVSSEKITVKGDKGPYRLVFTKELDLSALAPGHYTLSFTHAVKKGGTWADAGKDMVKLSDHTVTFTVGA